MKKYLLLFTIVSNAILAQPVLTAANSNPVLGESFHFITSPNQTSTGSAGTNQTWDFSSLSSNLTRRDSVIPPANAIHGSDFPTANISIFNGSYYSFYKTSNDSLTWRGEGSFSWVNIHTNPQILFTYPFTYNTNFTDSFSGTFDNAGSAGTFSGTITVTADGYGTLMLPNGTYNDVLRVKRVENRTTIYQGTPTNSIDTKYAWYLPNIHSSLLNMQFVNQTGDYNTEYITQINIGIESIEESSLFLYPNPFSEQLTLSLNTSLTNATVSIINHSGSIIREYKNIYGNNFILKRDDLTPGIYLLEIIDGKTTLKKRISVY